MTDDAMKPSDLVYYGIRSLQGWDEALDKGRDWGGVQARNVGRLLSAVLVAGGEDRTPVAITGELDEQGTGSLAVLYDDVVVVAKAVNIEAGNGTSEVSLHPLRGVACTGVATEHIYYDGTSTYPRHHRLEVHVSVGGEQFTFRSRTYDANQLTDDDAVKAALNALRKSFAA